MKRRLFTTSVLVLFLGLPSGAHGGSMRIWQLKETASAPVLVTGRVLAVHKNERIPEDQLAWKAETWSMTADIEVLRFWTVSGNPLPFDRLQVHFLAYGPSVTMMINGYPPPLPNIKADEIRILPLQKNNNPGVDPWQLMADSGEDVTIPATGDLADAQPAPLPTGRAFLIREFANTLSRGTPAEIAAMSAYLFGQREDFSGELMPLLEAAIGNDRQKWVTVAANLRAPRATPRPTADALLAQALGKLKPSPETDELLIRAWIAMAPVNAWGAANSLVEYADNPITMETLRQALRDDLRGSSYIAMVLARNGNKTILPEALVQALRVVGDPEGHPTDYGDLEGAAALLRDHGSDRDLAQLAALVRKYQTLAPVYYSTLWQYATEAGNPREMWVLAVVLNDRRIVFGETRYCDMALSELERATGQHFGAGDQAVSKAQAWLKTQGVTN